MIVCWLPMTSQGNLLLYAGDPVPKYLLPFITLKAGKLFLIVRESKVHVQKWWHRWILAFQGMAWRGHLPQLLTFIQTGLCVLQPSQEDSHYSLLKNLHRLVPMKSLKWCMPFCPKDIIKNAQRFRSYSVYSVFVIWAENVQQVSRLAK